MELINQLRDKGKNFDEAILEASESRLRPILMTSLTTAIGSLPLIFTSGAGSETRIAIGIVIFFGVVYTTVFTLFVVPITYSVSARSTDSPLTVTRELERQLQA